MMKAKKVLSAVTALTLLPVIGAATSAPTAKAESASSTLVRLDPSNASPFNNGEFEGWGTSLCWWANRVGYSTELTKATADAFFSEDGLSLDIARYNIGGGDDPDHDHITRSDSEVPGVWDTYSYINNGADVEMTYDITNDQNQLNVAKAALDANPDIYFEGFSNSPPYFMTNSGCSSGAIDANTDNLRSDMYDDFARYIADATKLMADEGIIFESYSPMNEPDTNYWGANSNKQEGCHYDPGTSQSNMIIETRKALDEAGLTDVLVAGMDETSIDKSVTNLGSLTAEAQAALGRIDTHTYSGSRRAQLKAKAIEMGKDLWMSEVDGGWDGFGLADRIILDMNGMMPSAWVMWDIIDVHKDSEFTAPNGDKSEAENTVSYTCQGKDGKLIWGLGMADHDEQKLILTNKYYMFGQFTRYIEPGDTIIASSDSTLAAYNKKTGDIKIVVSNSSGTDIPYSFDLSAFVSVGTEVSEIRSDRDGNEKWAEITGDAVLENKVLDTTAKAGTVTTYVISGADMGDTAITSFKADQNGMSYSYNADGTDHKNAYFAVYDQNSILRYISADQSAGTVSGDFSGCTPKLMLWDENQAPSDKAVTEVTNTAGYGFISGGTDELDIGTEASLSLATNINGDISWSVSDDTIAEITQDGKLTAKALGEFTVEAKVGGCTFQRGFTVPFRGTITGVGSTLRVDMTAQLSLDANIEVSSVKWSVSDDNIASVTADGILTALAPGSVTIYAEANGYTAEKTINIQLYTVTGTPSWSSSSSAPADKDDYLKATDGDFSTYFDGLKDGWVQYDYGAPFKVSSIMLAAREGYEYRTVNSSILASNDGIDWTELYRLDSEITSNEYTTVSSEQLSNNYAYRYYRYTNTDDSSSDVMTNIAEFRLEGEFSENIPEGDPLITDIEAFTDSFEGSTNIFGADTGTLEEDGNQIYASGLSRYGNVFVPVKDTAKAELSEPIELAGKDMFRMTFTMFSGWESSGKNNSFALKDKDGNTMIEIITKAGGYQFEAINIGGENVLASSDLMSQCRNKPGTSKAGANGWNDENQPYVNTVGYNKSVEIFIDGAGNVSVSLTGGMADVSVKGTLSTTVSIGSIELTGDYNSARNRVVSYDDLDADVISYSTDIATSAVE